MKSKKKGMLHKKLKNKRRSVKEFSYSSFKNEIVGIYMKEKHILKRIQNQKARKEALLEEKENALKKDNPLGLLTNNDASNDFKNGKEFIFQNEDICLEENDESEQTIDEESHHSDIKKSTKVKRTNSLLDEGVHSGSKRLHKERERKKKKKKKRRKRPKLVAGVKDEESSSDESVESYETYDENEKGEIIKHGSDDKKHKKRDKEENEETEVIVQILNIIITKNKIKNIIRKYFENGFVNFVSSSMIRYIIRKAKKKINILTVESFLVKNVDINNLESTIITNKKVEMFRDYIFSRQKIKTIETALVQICKILPEDFNKENFHKEFEITQFEYLRCIEVLCTYLLKQNDENTNAYKKYKSMDVFVKQILYKYMNQSSDDENVMKKGDKKGRKNKKKTKKDKEKEDKDGISIIDNTKENVKEKNEKENETHELKENKDENEDIILSNLKTMDTKKEKTISCSNITNSSFDEKMEIKNSYSSFEILKIIDNKFKKRDLEINNLKKSIESIGSNIKLLLQFNEGSNANINMLKSVSLETNNISKSLEGISNEIYKTEGSHIWSQNSIEGLPVYQNNNQLEEKTKLLEINKNKISKNIKDAHNSNILMSSKKETNEYNISQANILIGNENKLTSCKIEQLLMPSFTEEYSNVKGTSELDKFKENAYKFIKLINSDSNFENNMNENGKKKLNIILNTINIEFGKLFIMMADKKFSVKKNDNNKLADQVVEKNLSVSQSELIELNEIKDIIKNRKKKKSKKKNKEIKDQEILNNDINKKAMIPNELLFLQDDQINVSKKKKSDSPKKLLETNKLIENDTKIELGKNKLENKKGGNILDSLNFYMKADTIHTLGDSIKREDNELSNSEDNDILIKNENGKKKKINYFQEYMSICNKNVKGKKGSLDNLNKSKSDENIKKDKKGNLYNYYENCNKADLCSQLTNEILSLAKEKTSFEISQTLEMFNDSKKLDPTLFTNKVSSDNTTAASAKIGEVKYDRINEDEDLSLKKIKEVDKEKGKEKKSKTKNKKECKESKEKLIYNNEYLLNHEKNKLSESSTESGDSVVYNYNIYDAIYDMNEQFSNVVKSIHMDQNITKVEVINDSENEEGENRVIEKKDKKKREKGSKRKKERKRQRKEELKKKKKELREEKKKFIKEYLIAEKKKEKKKEKEKKAEQEKDKKIEHENDKKIEKDKKAEQTSEGKKVDGTKSVAPLKKKKRKSSKEKRKASKEKRKASKEKRKNSDYNFIDIGSNDEKKKIVSRQMSLFDEYITQEEAIKGIISKKYIRGIISIRRPEYGFIIHEDKQVHIESKENLNRAIDGDVVVVELNKVREGRDETKIKSNTGKVVYIEEHYGSNVQYVCIFREKVKDKTYNIAIPFKKNIPLIKVQNNHIKDFMEKSNIEDIGNQLVYIKIFQWNSTEKFPEGKIVEILGQNDVFHNMQNAILLNHNLNFNLKDALEDQYLKDLKNKDKFIEIVTEELQKRMDLRQECVFTIDPETARDLDDAINICKINKKIIMNSNYYIKIMHNLMCHNGDIDETLLEQNLPLFVNNDKAFFEKLKQNQYVKQVEDIKQENFMKEKVANANEKEEMLDNRIGKIEEIDGNIVKKEKVGKKGKDFTNNEYHYDDVDNEKMLKRKDRDDSNKNKKVKKTEKIAKKNNTCISSDTDIETSIYDKCKTNNNFIDYNSKNFDKIMMNDDYKPVINKKKLNTNFSSSEESLDEYTQFTKKDKYNLIKTNKNLNNIDTNLSIQKLNRHSSFLNGKEKFDKSFLDISSNQEDNSNESENENLFNKKNDFNLFANDGKNDFSYLDNITNKDWNKNKINTQIIGVKKMTNNELFPNATSRWNDDTSQSSINDIGMNEENIEIGKVNRIGKGLKFYNTSMHSKTIECLYNSSNNEGNCNDSKKGKGKNKYAYIFKQNRNKDIGSELYKDCDNYCAKCKKYITIDDIINSMDSEKWRKYNLYEVGVHITDVSYFVKENTSLDIDARNRAMTIYLTHTCFPMLSRILSEHLCSLDPINNRLCLSVFFYMDNSGKIDHNTFFIKETVIESKVKFTYEEVHSIVSGYVQLKKIINKLKKDEKDAFYAKHTNYDQSDKNSQNPIEARKVGSIVSNFSKMENENGLVKNSSSNDDINMFDFDQKTKKKNLDKIDVNVDNTEKKTSKKKDDNNSEKKGNSLYKKFLNLHFYSKKKNPSIVDVDSGSEKDLGGSPSSITNMIIGKDDDNNNKQKKFETPFERDMFENKGKGMDSSSFNFEDEKSIKKKNGNIIMRKKDRNKINERVLQNEQVKKGIEGIIKIFKNLNNKKHKLSEKEIINITKMLYDMYKITKGARTIRRKNGSILFNNDRINFVLSNSWSPLGIVKKKHTFANYMIEELMLSANKLVAIRQYFSKYRDASIFRSHNASDSLNVSDIIELLKMHGIEFEVNDLGSILDFLADKQNNFKNNKEKNNIFEIVCAFVKKKMVRAEYHTYKHIKENDMSTYHYALSFLLYTHFTSPIRRYPDIIVHRVIKKIINDEKKVQEKLCTSQEILSIVETPDVGIIENICENCNKCKARSKRAQMDCEMAFLCLYLQKRESPGYNKGIIMDIQRDRAAIYFKSFSFENFLSFTGIDKHYHKINKTHLKYLCNYTIQPNVAKGEFTLIVYKQDTKTVKLRKVYKRFDYIPLYLVPLNTMPPSFFLAVAFSNK
ncbi:ribonuclease, putative [Plasmodium chabaudi adami]|uniref:Ribonuclease, putative n=1 Tax=Plasmodium chabaudi adami TaxID=5826 RepID=A0A1C6YIK9_PLACE|nr:ribonuclease, putative [Plasmodium chabaudi adami]